MANKVQVVIEGVGNFQDVIRSVQGVQSSLDKLKVPQDLKNRFDQIFKGLEKDATRAQELLESGFKNKSDLTAYNKAIDGIVRSMRDMDTLIEIADYFDVSIDYLLGREK